MQKTPPRILITCGHYWTSPYKVGMHHFAAGLVRRGWDVAFLSSPLSPLHVFSVNREDLRTRIEIYREGGRRYLDGKLWSYVPGALLTPTNRPLLRSAAVCRHWQRLTVPPLGGVLARAGFGEVDVLFLDNPAQAGLLRTVKHRRSVFRIGDKMDGFENFPATLVAMERTLAAAVDLVGYSAQTLAPHIESLGPRHALCLPNGVQFEHFAHAHQPVPEEYANLPRPIAVYVGAMEEWFEFALVTRAAAEMPGISFVLIGPDRLARERIPARHNIHILGPRRFDQLPPYLHHADVGLIPFDVAGHGRLVHTVNPLKLYEYMACGLRVVSAAWRELEVIKSPAHLYRSPDEFTSVLRAALAAPADKDVLTAFARTADWGTRVDLLLRTLDGL
jgi:glycosyltransferase involved in cell wall biosynthesis